MLTEFPLIHTNVWDAFGAIPVILFVLLLANFLMKVPSSWLSTVATVVALLLSIFISHPIDLSAGIFMGFLYSGVALGFIYSFQTFIEAFQTK